MDDHAWTTRVRGSFLGPVAISMGALVALFVVLAVLVSVAFWLPALFVALLGLVLASMFYKADVTIDDAGVHVRFGVFDWPSVHVPHDDIESAEVIDVRPRTWGGWGYRGSLEAFGKAAVVMRAGPGIKLDVRGGKVFVVTLDEPEQAIAALERAR